MGTGAFRTDQVVQIDGAAYRLLRMVTASCWQLEQQKTLRIREIETSDLLKNVCRKKLTFPTTIDNPRRLTSLSEMSDEVSEIAKIRRMYVLAAMNVPNTRKRLEQVIDEIWNRTHIPAEKPGYATVYRWKVRYQQAGEDYRALVDNHKAKGNRTSRFEAEAVALTKQAIDEKYMTREGWNLQQTLDHAIGKVVNENQLRPEEFKIRTMPTRPLIKRLISEIPAYDKHAARKGFTSAQRAFRSLKGHIIAEAPLERAEIDHTLLDLVVLDDHTLEPAGRPWVTACIDAYSRCVLGVYVRFIPPSEQSVARCLKDCLRVKLRDEYPELQNEWNTYGKMHELVVDNGLEFHCKRLERVCLSLNINMRYSPRKQAWFKGHIERFLGTLNGFVHGIPGTSFSNPGEKGDYDPVKKASLTLSQVRDLLRRWIVDVYHQHPHRGIETTPAKLWAASIHQTTIELPDESVDLEAVMAKSFKRVLTHKGIEFEGLLYNSAELRDLRLRLGERIEVEIRVDEENLGLIYVVAPGSSQLYSVPALKLEYASGISLVQHKMHKNWRRDGGEADRDTGDWMAAREQIVRQIQEESSTNKRQRRTQRRVARYQEGGQQAEAKANSRQEPDKQEGTHNSSPATSRSDSEHEPGSATREIPNTTSAVDHADYKAIYKEGY